MSPIPFATANTSVLSCPPSSLVNGTRIPFRRWGISSRQSNHRCALLTTCSLKARWQIDARFGRKAELAKLLQDWVRDIGSEAGLTNANAALSSGAVGAPESRLILEVEMDDMASLEAFWSRIPAQQHEAWCRAIQDMIVDGTPKWEVFRTIPIYADAKDVASSSVGLTIIDDKDEAADIIGQVAMQTGSSEANDFASNLKTSASGLSIVDNLEDVDRILGIGSSDANVPSPEDSTVNKPKPGTSKFPLDWKGEPMKINPGDKFPRFQ